MALLSSGFLCDVNVMNARDFISGPCSCISRLEKQNCLPQSHLIRSNMLLANGFQKRNMSASGSIEAALWKTTAVPSKSFSILQSLKPCGVKSDDTHEAYARVSILQDENTLKQHLQIAIEEENYAEAAKIRDSLKARQADSEASVLSANARFYESFRNGDLAAMQTLWAKSENVCCVHPGAKGITGYELVMESWEIVWMNYEFPLEIELKDVTVHVRGDVGYITCMEFVKTKGNSWGAQFATNVFERIDGEWFVCIHHASPVDL